MAKVKGFIDSENLRAIVIGIEVFSRKSEISLENSLSELKELAHAAGIKTVYTMSQKKNRIEVGTYLGTGKLDEIKALAARHDAEILLVDDELSGIQIRNLESILDLEIIDRTSLILDIFANRAKSKEGKLQVELARLRYEKPRIVGGSTQLSKQAGGIGSRGLGEKKMELDRRTIDKKISDVEKAIEKLKKQREVQKNKRKKSHLKTVALIGYTNAGKSTLMNTFLRINNPLMSKQESPTADMLFATLDPFHRKVKLKDNLEFILTDTVGFVSKLPHALVDAFMSTLEEVKDADLLLYVVDVSNEEYEHQLMVTKNVVKELGAEDIPFVIVQNKKDRLSIEELEEITSPLETSVPISALTGEGLGDLIDIVEERILEDYKLVNLKISFEFGSEANYILENMKVQKHEYLEDGLYVETYLNEYDLAKYKEFVI
ncbi:MAG: GTPase HflX [Psychrilyobacter sp.]|nr:GTPase HflX [Psychrilyobacter sp.]